MAKRSNPFKPGSAGAKQTTADRARLKASNVARRKEAKIMAGKSKRSGGGAKGAARKGAAGGGGG